MMHKYLLASVASLALALACGAEVSLAQSSGATLFLSPRTGVFPVGDTFPVTVRIDTGGESIGSADVTVGYDPNDLAFVSYSTEGSVFSSIIKDEDASTYGKVRLQGIVSTNRGPYEGGEGLFATLVFRPVRSTATQVWFAEGSAAPLVASVGTLASNILSAPLQSATYTLVPKDVVPAAIAYAQSSGSGAIATDPEPQNGWFGTTSVSFSWDIPAGAEAMRTGFTDKPDDIPTKVYEVPVSSVTLDDLEEGSNYFHVQFKVNGSWGTVLQEAVNIDLTPPDQLTAREVRTEGDKDPRLSFEITAHDAGSGVVRYEVGIDDGDAVAWERPSDGKYRLTAIEPGEHVLITTAYDAVGNSTSTSINFLMHAIASPVLSEVPDRVLTGDTITVTGSTFPDSEVTVYKTFDDGEVQQHTVQSDENGVFVATVAESARAGKYTVWFSVVDEHGAKSPPSIKRSVTVSQPFIMLFGSMAVTYLSVVVPLIALIFLLGLVVWLGYTWVRTYRRRVRTETNEAYGVVHSEFAKLRGDLIRQIGVLEKANQSRELTHEEMRIFRDLSKQLDHIERHIADEIEDIEVVQDEDGVTYKGVGHNTLGKYQQTDPSDGGHAVTPQYAHDEHTVHLKPRRQ